MFSLLLSPLCLSAAAVNVTWDGSTNTDWDNATNWSTDRDVLGLVSDSVDTTSFLTGSSQVEVVLTNELGTAYLNSITFNNPSTSSITQNDATFNG